MDLRSDGTLAGVRASGHAGREPAGANIACAAATVLLRTAGSLLAAAGAAQGGADRPGELAFTVALPRGRGGGAEVAWLRGVSEFLLRGLRDLERERPDAVSVTVSGGKETQ